MKNKFYGVIAPAGTHIYTDWDTCKKAISGVSNVVYRGFTTRAEAEEFIEGAKNSVEKSVKINEPKIKIYTDGSGVLNGGFGVVILNGDDIFKAYGRLPFKGTSSSAELYAIYIALSLVADEDVKILTDSQTSIASITKYYQYNKTIANNDIIEKIMELSADRTVLYEHVPGHADIKYNEECDRLARLGASNKDALIIYKNDELYQQ